ncbi:unnamed protein product [Euphydryas editha]|uniref:Reverse transcriptase n=1 Tax=Euphydryas editha TaxID=104508 RepID=A0AAU9TZH1_EUPED|nr:unnamed protein product [Euphydryas editha]
MPHQPFDDAPVLSRFRSFSSYNQIVATNRMQRLLDLFDKWRMAVNVGKTAALLTGNHRPLRRLTLRGQDIRVEELSKVPLQPEATHDSNRQQGGSSCSGGLDEALRRLPMKTKLMIYGAYIRLRLTYVAPAWYALCSTYHARRLQIQQNRCLQMIVEALRYVRDDVVHRDTRTPTVEEYVRHLARTIFARADKGACVHLHERSGQVRKS